MCPAYRGEALYSREPAVLGSLGVMSPEVLDAWLELNLAKSAESYARFASKLRERASSPRPRSGRRALFLQPREGAQLPSEE